MGNKNIFIEFTVDTNQLRAFAEVAVKFGQEQGLKAERADQRKRATIHIRPKTVLEYACKGGELVQCVADDARFNHTVYNSARGSQFAVQFDVFALLKVLKSCWKYIARPSVLVRVEGDHVDDMMLYLCNTVSEEIYASITCGITSARSPQEPETEHVAYVEPSTFDTGVATCVKNTRMLKSSREFAHTIHLRAQGGVLWVEQTDAIRLTRCDIVVHDQLGGFNHCVNATALRATSSVFSKYINSKMIDMSVSTATLGLAGLVFTPSNNKRFLVALPHVEINYPQNIDKVIGSYFERLIIPGARLKKIVATIGKHIESKHCPVTLVMSNDALMLAVEAPKPAEYGYYAVCDNLATMSKPSVFGVRVRTLDFDLLKTAVASIADKKNMYVELKPANNHTAIFGVSTIGFERSVHFPTLTDQRPREHQDFERVVLGHFDKSVYGVFASSGVAEGELDNSLQADLPEPITIGELKQLLNPDKPTSKATVGSEVIVATPTTKEPTMNTSNIEVVEATMVDDAPEDTSVSVQEVTEAKQLATVYSVPAGIPVKQIAVLQGAEHKPKALRDDKGRKLGYVAMVRGLCVVVLRDWYQRDSKQFERLLADTVQQLGFELVS